MGVIAFSKPKELRNHFERIDEKTKTMCGFSVTWEALKQLTSSVLSKPKRFKTKRVTYFQERVADEIRRRGNRPEFAGFNSNSQDIRPAACLKLEAGVLELAISALKY
tara:strand:+ start:29654 stop:29977 length:324 start_codon:yes stop_codon:yes gene_type:complete